MNNKTIYKGIDAIHYAFQITRRIIFEVNYCQWGNNETAHFSTTLVEFNRSKTNWTDVSQLQEKLFPHDSSVYSFYKKWERFHLQELSEEKIKELIKDIQKLSFCYNSFCFSDQFNHEYFLFEDLRDLSMASIKKTTVKSVDGYYLFGRPKRLVHILEKHSNITF